MFVFFSFYIVRRLKKNSHSSPTSSIVMWLYCFFLTYLTFGCKLMVIRGMTKADYNSKRILSFVFLSRYIIEAVYCYSRWAHLYVEFRRKWFQNVTCVLHCPPLSKFPERMISSLCLTLHTHTDTHTCPDAIAGS